MTTAKAFLHLHIAGWASPSPPSPSLEQQLDNLWMSKAACHLRPERPELIGDVGQLDPTNQPVKNTWVGLKIVYPYKP